MLQCEQEKYIFSSNLGKYICIHSVCICVFIFKNLKEFETSGTVILTFSFLFFYIKLWILLALYIILGKHETKWAYLWTKSLFFLLLHSSLLQFNSIPSLTLFLPPSVKFKISTFSIPLRRIVAGFQVFCKIFGEFDWFGGHHIRVNWVAWSVSHKRGIFVTSFLIVGLLCYFFFIF